MSKYKVFNDSGLQALVGQTKANKTLAEENSSAIEGLSTDFQEMSSQVTNVLGEVETCLNELDEVKADTATVTAALEEKANVADVYVKTETYTQEEVNTLIADINTQIAALEELPIIKDETDSFNVSNIYGNKLFEVGADGITHTDELATKTLTLNDMTINNIQIISAGAIHALFDEIANITGALLLKNGESFSTNDGLIFVTAEE